jgi:6-phosphofructokinase 1
LVGKKTGFLCVEASLASGNVNMCLIPEIKWSFSGKDGLLSYVDCFLK